MLITRFWIFVLAVVAGLSIAAMGLTRSLYEHDRFGDVGAMLATDRKLVDEFLRHDAHQRLDDLSGVTLDAQVMSLLETRSHSTDDTAAVIGHAITDRLRVLNQDLGPLRGEILFAVDLRGVVVGRVGLEEGSVGQNLGGLPLVASALRGNVRDDLWEISGTAYRMAARPVVSRGQYYVGAIVHGQAINQGFVERVGQLVPGASVMFFGPEGLLVAVAPPNDGGGRAPPPPAVLADGLHTALTRSDWQTRGYTEPLPDMRRDGEVVFASLPGMLGAGGGGFAVGRPLPVLPADFLLHAARPDLARLPWALIVALVLGATLVGFGLVWFEYDSKKRALRDAFKALHNPGTDHLDPLELSGFARGIAVAANDGIEAVVKREVDRSAGRRQSVGEIKSMLEAQASTPPSAPPPPFVPMPMPARPPVVMPGPPPPAPTQRNSSDVEDLVARVAGVPPEVRPGEDPEEPAHWREVYNQFIEKRKECNEPVESLTYEKFTATLQKHKDALMIRTQCRGVRFQVVVSKDGKATLKASPLR